MLEHLHIKNVALIAESELHFEKGLNILTGETGAGKSMIIDSLHFALGGRVNRDFLRKEEQSAVVEALFSTDNPKVSVFLEENGIPAEEDGTLLIARTMQASGKTVARVNGSTVTAGMLKELAGELLDIYGQHEHQSLLNPSRHIHLLDRFCGEALEEKLVEYRKEFGREKELKKCSRGWLHHKGRNPHHFEYWIDYSFKPRGLVGMKMPKKYVAEMVIDRICASKNYMKEKYKDSSALEYYMNGREMMLVDPETDFLSVYLLTMLSKRGEDYLLRYMKKVLLKHRNRDYHVIDGKLVLD